MKESLRLSFRYIKKNKLRTLVTLFGIIISISMFTSIGNILTTIKHIGEQEIKLGGGDYDAYIYRLDDEKYRMLKSNKDIASLSKNSYRHSLFGKRTENDQEIRLNYLDVLAVDENYLADVFPYELLEGRMPEKEGEIIIPYKSKYLVEGLSSLDKKADFYFRKYQEFTETDGDGLYRVTDHYRDINSIKCLETGQVSYKVVGYFNGDNKLTNINLEDKNQQEKYAFAYGLIGEDEPYNVYIKFSDYKKINEKFINIQKQAASTSYDSGLNHGLLQFRNVNVDDVRNGQVVFVLMVVSLLVGIIIFAITIFIYNMLTTNYLERTKDYGLLKVIGITNRQLKEIIYIESIFYILVTVPLGYLAGNVAMRIVFSIVRKILTKGNVNAIFGNIKYYRSGWVFLVAFVLTTVVVLISTRYASKFIIRMDSIDAVNENFTRLKKPKKKKAKRFFFTEKIFGYEAFLARRNIERNKRRFLFTTFSVSMSIILFVSVSFIMTLIEPGYIGGSSYDKEYLSAFSLDEENVEEVEKEIRRIEGVDIAKKYSSYSKNIYVAQDLDEFENLVRNMVEEDMVYDSDNDYINQLLVYNKETSNSVLLIMDDKDYIRYVNNQLSDQVEIARVLPKVKNKDNYERKLLSFYGPKIIDGNNQLMKDKIIEDPVLIHETDIKLPRNITNRHSLTYKNEIYLMKESDYKKLDLREDSRKWIIEVKANSKFTNKTNYELESIDQYIPRIYREENVRSITSVVKIFVYGFISLIAIISGLNIINTSYNNIMIRKKELALIMAVGISERRLKKMVRFESVYSWIYATIWAIGLSFLVTYVQYRQVYDITIFMSSPYMAPIKQLIGAIIITYILIYISSMIPLKRILKENIIDELKMY